MHRRVLAVGQGLPESGRVILPAIAVTLAGVTAASVGLAIVERIPVPHLAGMFATAGVALEAFKYMAWPKAAGLLEDGRKLLAGGMAASALALAGFSGWATYDRVAGALTLPPPAETAGPLIAAAERRLAQLEADRDRVVQQADAMRSRGMVTPALEFETSATRRLDERERELAKELRELRKSLAEAPPRAEVPQWAIPAAGLGFAIALELVPVLIFCSMRRRRKSAEPLEPLELQTVAPPADLGEPAEVLVEPCQEAQVEPAPAQDDDQLLERLLAYVGSLEPGTPVPQKEFARTVQANNARVVRAFTAAAERGVIIKSKRGYVAA